MQLYDYQEEAVAAMIKSEKERGLGLVLAMAMGTGKTLTMASMLIRSRSGRDMPDLIIAPVCVLSHWKAEIRRIGCDIDVYLHYGKDRKELMKRRFRSADVVISSYHSLLTRELEVHDWNRIVLDEAHTIRNGARSGVDVSEFKKMPKRAVNAFSLAHRGRFRYCLTGTPFNNRVDDLVALQRFVGYCGSVDAFVQEMFFQKTTVDIMLPVIEIEMWIDPPEDMPGYRKLYASYTRALGALKRAETSQEKAFWRETLNRLMQRLRIVCDLIYCDYMRVDKLKKLLDAMEKNPERYRPTIQNLPITQLPQIEEFIESLGGDVDGEGDASDATDSDFCEENEDYYYHSPKIKCAVDLIGTKINTLPSRRIVIFSAFLSVLEAMEYSLNVHLPHIRCMKYTGSLSARKRDEIVAEFTGRDLPGATVLLITIGSGNTGLNLVPCSIVFLMDVSLNPFESKQAISRVHRVTQKNQVFVYSFIMKGMIEEVIRSRQHDKISTACAYEILI